MEHTAYIEKVRQLLKDRSVVLHKSGSIRRIHDEETRDRMRVVYEAQAALLKDQLVDTVAAQFPDKRPAPVPEFEYSGKRMVIQRYDGVTCTYVAEENFNAEAYEYKQSDYRDHIQAEISRH